MAAVHYYFGGPGRLITMLSDAIDRESSASSSDSFFDNSSSSSSSSSSGSNYTVRYRQENYMPPWVAGIIVGCCAGVFAITLLVAILNCCRGKKLLDTDEDEERLMADEYFDPEDAVSYSRNGSFRSAATRSNDVRSFGRYVTDDSDSDSEEGDGNDEFFATPQPLPKKAPAKRAPAKRAPAKKAPAKKSAGPTRSRSGGSHNTKPARQGFYATVNNGGNRGGGARRSREDENYSNFATSDSSDSGDDDSSNSSSSSGVYDDDVMDDYYSGGDGNHRR